jgi:hypothetical protein
LRIANCSGFWGDRLSAAEEMVRGGPIDVLTGDYLAELSMALLHRSRAKNPRGGFVPTFLKQLEGVLGDCLKRGIKIVSNAGGLNPRGLATAIEELAAKLGLHLKVAFVDGDDLTPRLDELRRAGEAFVHLDRGVALDQAPGPVVSANAYLGGWGIREALDRGADVVVTGRVTDAALVVGPAAWRFGWKRDDWDRLAGAVAAGHVIECSAQATGGNYAFFDEVPSFAHVGFPIAEVREDGSFVVTKHPGTGGLVSVGTVTAQLLYEIQSAAYLNPDVIARFDTLRVTQEGPDRVLVDGARGWPAPRGLKVSINCAGGFRNAMTVLLGGTEIERKALLVEDALFASLGGRERFDHVDVRLERMDQPDPPSAERAVAHLKIAVFGRDEALVGRRFANAVVELALSSVPGFSSRTPPGDATPYFTFWPALVDRAHVEERVHVGGEDFVVAPPPVATPSDSSGADPSPPASTLATGSDMFAGPTVRVPFGRLFGTRSGDKGGNANLGVWARDDAAWAFLQRWLTVERLVSLCADFAPFPVERHELANLRALNFVIRGLLGEGVAASARIDPQAKTLGEYVRAKLIDVPRALVDAG